MILGHIWNNAGGPWDNNKEKKNIKSEVRSCAVSGIKRKKKKENKNIKRVEIFSPLFLFHALWYDQWKGHFVFCQEFTCEFFFFLLL